jgi:hypothetical protein
MPTQRQSPTGIFATDDWQLAQGNIEGKRLIVRMRATFPSTEDQAHFCRLVIISWHYEGNESGMPERDIHKKMNAFEDALEAGTEKRQVAFQALSITGDGKKEWRYYAADMDEFMNSLNTDLSEHEEYPLQIQSFLDPDWSALREYHEGSQ